MRVMLRSEISNARFGSLAALQNDISPMSASGCKPDIRRADFERFNINVRFSRKRTFRLAKTSCFERPLSAKSGHGELSLSVMATNKRKNSPCLLDTIDNQNSLVY